MTAMPDDADERRNALALWKAMRDAEVAWENCEPAFWTNEQVDKMHEIRQRYRAEIDALHAKRDAEIRDVEMATVDPERAALESAYDTAFKAYEDAPGGAILEDESGEAIHCAASGVPLYEQDEVVADDETGEVFLRSAIGLPRRDSDDAEEAA